jgi:hypothetical protein
MIMWGRIICDALVFKHRTMMMDPTTADPAPESSKASIIEDGVLCFEDPDIGRRVSEFDKQGFPFQTEDGLDFCRINTIDDAASSNDQLLCTITI